MIITCKCCGSFFETQNKRQQYCSDRCRVKAFRERQKIEPEREAERYKKWQEIQARAEVNRKEFQKSVKSGDVTARLLHYKRQGICSAEYWKAFQQYDKEKGEQRICSVNGIRTDHPHFVDAVLISISEEKRLCINAEQRGETK